MPGPLQGLFWGTLWFSHQEELIQPGHTAGSAGSQVLLPSQVKQGKGRLTAACAAACS